MSRLARRWRRGRTARPPVPTTLVDEVRAALARLDDRRSELGAVLQGQADLAARRAAYAAASRAFADADALLREATALARARSFGEWSLWRSRLSRLDRARQEHLFAGADGSAVLAQCWTRAVDTGMSGPAIGELQHGESRPGAAASYGVDLDLVLGVSAAAAARPDPVQPPEPHPRAA